MLDVEALAAAAAAASLRPRAAEARGDLQQALSAHQKLVFALLDTLRSLLRPLQQLESIARYETLRQEANPLIAPVISALNEASSALAANGIVQSGPTIGEPFDEEQHERHARGGVSPDDNLLDDLIIKEVVRPGYVHRATGAVLLPALVSASSSSGGGKMAPAIESASALVETPRGSRVHEVRATDTLQGIALRYGCQTAALMRLNKLPTAHALHARKTLRLPPPSASSVAERTPPARSETGEPLWGPVFPILTTPANGAVLVTGGDGEEEATGGGGSARSSTLRGGRCTCGPRACKYGGPPVRQRPRFHQRARGALVPSAAAVGHRDANSGGQGGPPGHPGLAIQ